MGSIPFRSSAVVHLLPVVSGLATCWPGAATKKTNLRPLNISLLAACVSMECVVVGGEGRA